MTPDFAAGFRAGLEEAAEVAARRSSEIEHAHDPWLLPGTLQICGALDGVRNAIRALPVPDGAARGAAMTTHESAAPKDDWLPVSEVIEQPGLWIEVRTSDIFRWTPYRRGHVENGKTGRWQKLNEYGGFDNAGLPNTCWRPHRNPAPAPPEETDHA
jgi:hypothetical protein